ncbi:MAG: AraC family transcriptional regulator [Eubacteriales bacterium]|nr:AraC family transcriptional regulator [Eubacteriales bacterium]
MKKNLQSSFQKRQYMLSKDYEIYYYNDTKLDSVEAHSHSYYEFYFFLEGDVRMYIAEKEHALHPGDVLVIPPGIPHHAEIRDNSIPYRRFVFWISEAYASLLMKNSLDYGYIMQYVIQHKEYVFPIDRVTANELHTKVFRLLAEVHSERFGREAQIQVCIQDTLLFLNRKIYEQKHRNTESEERSLYQSLLLFIEEHLDEDLSLERLAREFYVSKYYLSHLFKDTSGFSLHQYITKKRLSQCLALIMTNQAITDVYMQYGFADYTSFYRAFKKEYGASPKEYKELHQSAEEL